MELDWLADHAPSIPRIRPKHDDDPQLKTPEELVTRKTEYTDRKVILLLRDVRDLAVSTYFQMTRRDKRFEGDIDAFLDCRRGSVDTMIRFHEIWYENRGVPADLLVVRYEDLHADAALELRRALAFVGVQDVSDRTIQEAVQFSSFGNMREMEAAGSGAGRRLRPADAADPESFKTRRGVVGGFVNYLGSAAIETIERKVRASDCPFVYGAGEPEAAVARWSGSGPRASGGAHEHFQCPEPARDAGVTSTHREALLQDQIAELRESIRPHDETSG